MKQQIVTIEKKNKQNALRKAILQQQVTPSNHTTYAVMFEQDFSECYKKPVLETVWHRSIR